MFVDGNKLYSLGAAKSYVEAGTSANWQEAMCNVFSWKQIIHHLEQTDTTVEPLLSNTIVYYIMS